MLRKITVFAKTIAALGFWPGLIFILQDRLKSVATVSLADTPYQIKPLIFLRPGTSDVDVFKQVFIEKEYDISLDFEPKVIVDAGANIGLASIYLRSRYPNAVIIAIEPDAENAEAFRRNLDEYFAINLAQASLWPTRTQTVMTDKYNMGKWAMVTEEVQDESDNNPNTVTMPEIFERFKLTHIDVLKLDIESAEKHLFASGYMEWLPRVKVIIIELHDWMTEGCSKPFFSAINEAFSNYTFRQVGENTVIINRDLVKNPVLLA